MPKDQKSRADEQMRIEQKLFSAIKRKLGDDTLVANADLSLSNTPGATIRPDFYSEANRIIGEIFAHRGNVKVGQSHKIAEDILKMLLFEKDRGCSFKKILVVCSAELERYLHGKSKMSAACQQFGIEIVNLESELSPKEIENLESAQDRQNFYPGRKKQD